MCVTDVYNFREVNMVYLLQGSPLSLFLFVSSKPINLAVQVIRVKQFYLLFLKLEKIISGVRLVFKKNSRLFYMFYLIFCIKIMEYIILKVWNTLNINNRFNVILSL